MFAIFKKELRSYFTTPIGYAFVSVLLALSGFFFCFTTLWMSSSDTSAYFTIMLCLFAILIPLLTMKLFAEERKLKTEQLLLTSPVGCLGMVLGKFFAAFVLFALTLILSCICNFVTLALMADISLNMAQIAGNITGILLIGASFIALGILISSLTENQLIAAVATIGAIVIMLLVSLFPSLIANEALRVVVKWISVLDRFTPFGYGIFSLTSVVYYISITVVFIFLTTRIFEKRRWE